MRARQRLTSDSAVAVQEERSSRRGVFPVAVIGIIESPIQTMERAPRQGSEGAPDAWLVLDAAFAPGLRGIGVGDDVIIVTWLHRACRDVLEVHPRRDSASAVAGVFATRSPHRPNPLGLHRVTVREICGTRLRIGPIEVIDGTPVVDVKAVLGGEVGA
jgi:tRNA-Thr(GGU) m(6)t(6)A37 methyltransferase TsaA